MINALTVDLEEWFCVSNFGDVIRREDWPRMESRVEGSTFELLDLLDRHRVSATFFVLGWVAERHPDLIRALVDRGHEVASHGYSHRLVYEQTPGQFEEDIERSIEVLAGLTGTGCEGYRAPSFSLRRNMEWAWKVLTGFGIRYDSSVFPVVHDRYGEPDAPRFPFRHRCGSVAMMEFPLSTVRLSGRNLPIAGGGYLRLYPYGVTRWGIRKINAEGQPAVVYLHPWEIDPGQPKPRAPYLRQIRHRIGIHSTKQKLDRLLGDFKFAPMREVLAGVVPVENKEQQSGYSPKVSNGNPEVNLPRLW